MNKDELQRDKIVSIVIIIISLVIMAGVALFVILKPTDNNIDDNDLSHTASEEETKMEIMPDLVGYSYEEVKAVYADYFDVVITGQGYSDEFLEGAILEQDLSAGTEYIKGKAAVQVTLSRGAKPAETTAVTEITEETAVSETDDGLTDGPINNPSADFEKLIPEDELELTFAGLEIPEGRGTELEEKLYGILRRRGVDAGFLYYDPQTGGSIEYNADERFSSGSIIKAVYARSILDSDIDLDAEYEMTEELLNSQYELVNGMPVGTMFTVRELIEAALVKSDNTAYKMLYHYIGYERFNNYAASLGLSQRMTDENYWFRMTPRESAKYFKEIYNFVHQHINGALMMECMSNAEYRDMFSSALPDRSVAEKYGYLPQEGFYTLGDCAIISGDTDYILVMYMRGTGENPNTQPFQEAAQIIDELHGLIRQAQ